MLWILGIFLGFWTQVMNAQEVSSSDPVRIESVQWGYSGYGHYSNWLPVWVQIKSTLDHPVQGTLELQGRSFSNIKVLRDFELPARGDQPFSLTPVLLSYPSCTSITFQLTVDSIGLNKTHQENNNIPMLGYSDFLLGVLAKRSADLKSKDLRYLTDQLLTKNQNLQFADIAPEELSGNWSLYSTLDCLVILDVSQVSILSAHQNAILDWVASGGKLFINGGDRAGALPQSFLQSALTFELTSKQISLNFSDHEFSKYLAKPRWTEASGAQTKILLTLPLPKTNPPDYKVIAQTESTEPIPLLIEQKVGNGKILFSTVDITQEPFKQNVLLLKFLVADPEIAKKYWDTIDHSKQTLFGYLLPYFHMKSSTFWVIFLFLGSYMAGVCLCHRQFSKKEKPLEFKVGLLPKNALFFSGVALILIQFVVPAQSIREIQILHYIENSPVAVQETMAIFQPATSESVEITPQNDGYLNLTELFEFDPSKQNSLSLRRSDIFLNDCEQGILRHWRWTSLYRSPESLQIRLEPESRNLKTGEVQSFQLDITNTLSQPVQNLFLVGRDCFVPLSDQLEVGKSLSRSGIASRQEVLPKPEDFFLPQLSLDEQQQVFAKTLWQEALNTIPKDAKDPVFYHILGFIQLPSAFKFSSSGQPLVFDSQKVWGMVHYQFSFPPSLFVKTLSPEETTAPEEEKEK